VAAVDRRIPDAMSEPLGLESGAVRLVPYDPRWPGLFEEAARELGHALGARALGIHHVGSTAIPGLPAKPVLDLLVSVPDLDAALALVPLLEPLGYELRPGDAIPDRHFLRRLRDGARTHHVSLAEPASWHHRSTLAFRDALRGDAGEAAAYAALKMELARRFPEDRTAYNEGKSAFVARVLAGRGVSKRAGMPKSRPT
jgi:GrpB-like predicted nucleotidyltransferase (UPF0157 family)